ncbi:hypothetical protein ASD21_04070 [Caulobacter sp. Root1455]|jgi:hypothetical protein|uniref:hypothetical protein n=1 Tax=unclassified Caulobacter TaxID=2648921 RepID=UPI0006FF7DDF|nr:MULTISPECIES: hypothetical protein [unclassified Caulobacter]KQY29719.1 hypothetical protein ASD38_10360 [Caulobacter sp. Root487D2Y]KQY95702.1 hypothetical protein ASD21_04070 [Caulobacter sp. Root1455]
MSLNIYLPPPAEKVERPRIAQRVAAVCGLAGLVLAWAVLLLPCAVWLLFSLVFNRLQSAPVRQQA